MHFPPSSKYSATLLLCVFSLMASAHPTVDSLKKLGREKLIQLAVKKLNEPAFNPAHYDRITVKANSALIQTPSETSDVFFSPGDTCRNVIIQQIQSATSQLQICVFTISDDSITNALLTAHKKGIKIKVITDNDKSLDEGSDIEQIARAGIIVKMDTTPNHMHHKFMIADQRALITGSYNWTRSAARFNHENILLCRENGVIKSFSKQFDQLWNVMTDY